MTHLEPEYPDAAKVSPFFRDFLQKEVADPEDDRLTLIVERHHPDPKDGPSFCAQCADDWPCDTAVVIAALAGASLPDPRDGAAIMARIATRADDVPWPIPESRAYDMLREQLYDVLKRNAIDDEWLAYQLADEMWRMLGHESSDRTPEAVG